jgi:hypothetical protein
MTDGQIGRRTDGQRDGQKNSAIQSNTLLLIAEASLMILQKHYVFLGLYNLRPTV